jgi:hypothetical protein
MAVEKLNIKGSESPVKDPVRLKSTTIPLMRDPEILKEEVFLPQLFGAIDDFA